MRIAVIGAGAVGCYYGGMLARAGHRVVLIGRPAHVAAIRQHGLHLDTQTFDGFIAVEADTDARALADAELVLCCVKSPDTLAAAREMASHLAQGVMVVSLQNGVDNAERLSQTLGVEVIPAVVYVAAEMAGPGHIKHHGRGELVFARSAHDARLAEVFSAAGVTATFSDNVAGELWAKLILNCAYNALSAITQTPYGRLVQGEGIEQVMRDVVGECLAVADALSIAVAGDPWAAIERIARTMPGQYSSTAQDLARAKTSEIDYINGHILRKGMELGIPTPVNRVLHALVKLLESRTAPPGA